MTEEELEALPAKAQEYIKYMISNTEYLLEKNKELTKKMETIREIIE